VLECVLWFVTNYVWTKSASHSGHVVPFVVICFLPLN
jgi:hypothetical protein